MVEVIREVLALTVTHFPVGREPGFGRLLTGARGRVLAMGSNGDAREMWARATVSGRGRPELGV